MNFDQPTLVDAPTRKSLFSDNYNFTFDKSTGAFARWGATLKDDPSWSPFGPEISDIEICKNGCPNKCAYCYKSNTQEAPYNMTLATFKTILDKLGPQLTQVAFGITGVKTNPDFIPMMEYCREKGVIPNFTLSGKDLDDADIPAIAKLVGAVAVSYHDDRAGLNDYHLCLDTVLRLNQAGIRQVNIHAVTANPYKIDRLMTAINQEREIANLYSTAFKLNALVLLSLKPKGRAASMANISEEDFRILVGRANRLNIPLGFDSCSAHRAMAVYPPAFHTLIEPCESGLFSAYINAYGNYYPCSFAEEDTEDYINVTTCANFLEDVWLSNRVNEWRRRLLYNERRCPLFKEAA